MVQGSERLHRFGPDAALLWWSHGTGTEARITTGALLRRAMRFTLARIWRRWTRPGAARLVGIYLAPAAGAPMEALHSVRALANAGLEGDRYAAGRGFWKVHQACQVTLIGEEDLERARQRAPALAATLNAGGHRRNLVIAGTHSRALLGRRLRIGDVELVVTRPRPPCGYLEQVEKTGLATALGRHSGVCANVQVGGTLQVGAAVEVVDD